MKSIQNSRGVNTNHWTNLTLSLIAVFAFAMMSFKPSPDKFVSKDVHINFYSHTDVEDISADNYKVVSTLEPATGKVVFSVPMQSFEFEKAAMQKHFNSSKFLNTREFPKAKFTGMISDIDSIDFSRDGTYPAASTGELTIKGITKQVNENGTVVVQDGNVTLNVKIKIKLADFEISFVKGKPSTNIAKEIEATVKAVYKAGI